MLPLSKVTEYFMTNGGCGLFLFKLGSMYTVFFSLLTNAKWSVFLLMSQKSDFTLLALINLE